MIEGWISYNEVVPQIVWDFVEKGQAHFGVVEGGIGIGCFGEGDRQGAALQRGLISLNCQCALRWCGIQVIDIASVWRPEG